jgi:hypothetical protein
MPLAESSAWDQEATGSSGHMGRNPLTPAADTNGLGERSGVPWHARGPEFESP